MNLTVIVRLKTYVRNAKETHFTSILKCVEEMKLMPTRAIYRVSFHSQWIYFWICYIELICFGARTHRTITYWESLQHKLFIHENEKNWRTNERLNYVQFNASNGETVEGKSFIRGSEYVYGTEFAIQIHFLTLNALFCLLHFDDISLFSGLIFFNRIRIANIYINQYSE